MNTAHRPAIFETRFLSDGPQTFARRSMARRIFHFIASATVLIAAGTVFIGWIGHG